MATAPGVGATTTIAATTDIMIVVTMAITTMIATGGADGDSVRLTRLRRSGPKRRLGGGGQGWIRTSVRSRGQIYSLLPLTTRPPVRKRTAEAKGGPMPPRRAHVNALVGLARATAPT